MSKERPIWERMYADEACIAIVRLIGYAGCPYRELWDKLKPLTERFGQQRVESATEYLLTFEGQFSCNPRPLAQVQLRADVRKLAFGLLGPPPEHPWYSAFKNNERIPLPWEKEETKPEEPDPTPRKKLAKRTRKKAK